MRPMTSVLESGLMVFARASNEFPRVSRLRLAAVSGGIVVSAGLFAASQEPIGLGIVSVLALVPWLASLHGMRPRRAAASGLAFGTLAGLLVAGWLAAGFSRLGASALHAGLGTLAVAAWGSGVPFALLGACASGSAWLRPEHRVLAVGAAAFGIDLARGAVPGGLPWTLLGHAAADVPGLAQLAVVGGVPLVSAVLVAVNTALAGCLTARSPGEQSGAWRALGLAGGGLTVVALLGLPLAARMRPVPAAGAAFSVLVMQPHLVPEERWSPLAQRTNLAILARETKKAVEKAEPSPDLVIWPENTLTQPVDGDPELAGDLVARVDGLGVPVVLGAVMAADPAQAGPPEIRTSALRVEPGRGITDVFDKTRAIPVVESAAVFPGFGLLDSLLGLAPGRSRVLEGRVERPLAGEPELAVALCFEMLFPGLVAERRGPDTGAIVNLGNDSWFLSPAPSSQQIAIARFRAIEQRAWVVRAVYGGASAVIDPLGRLVSALPFDSKGAMSATLVPGPPPGAGERLALVTLLLAGAALGRLLVQPVARRTSS